MISSFLAPLLITGFQLPFLLFISQTGQFLLFGLLSAYLWFTPSDPALTVVFTLVFAMSFLDGWATPIRNALIPRLATEESLMKANSLISVSDRIVQFAGWGFSGVLVSLIGPQLTLLLSIVLYAASFLFIALIRDPLERKGHFLLYPITRINGNMPKDTKIKSAPKLALLKEGFQTIGSSVRLKTLTFMDVIDLLGGSVWFGAFTLVFVQTVLHRGEEWWGFINTAYFAGTVIGGMIMLTLVKRLQKRIFAYMLIGMSVYAVLTAVYALTTLPAAALVIIALTGPATELSAISRHTLIQQSVHANALPKVLSAQHTILNMTTMVSLLLFGWIADQFGIVNTYLLTALLSVCAVLVGISQRRIFSNTDEQTAP
ncbi:MAG: MFS transporter [Candidatus Pristimantibacillus sp.]